MVALLLGERPVDIVVRTMNHTLQAIRVLGVPGSWHYTSDVRQVNGISRRALLGA